MGKFAVIDTETNWVDQVMSIGTVIADADTFAPVEMKYHILPAECQIGGMYYDALFLDTPVKPILCSSAEAIRDLRAWFRQHNPKIPADADCCSTGRLKRGYGVEPMLRLLSGERTYRETHNAMFDAVDELEIMRLIGHSANEYKP